MLVSLVSLFSVRTGCIVSIVPVFLLHDIIFQEAFLKNILFLYSVEIIYVSSLLFDVFNVIHGKIGILCVQD